MIPSIEIIIVGNEILSGRTIDRNSRHMIDGLSRSGFSVHHVSVVGDDSDALATEFRSAAARSDVILVTGGLGPTSDDLTIQAAADTFDKRLSLDERALSNIMELFRRRNRSMSDSNRKQAMIPEGARTIDNPVGTAPGVRMDAGGSRFYFLPGVPVEMRTIFDASILPELVSDFETARVEYASVLVTGVSESELYDRIRHLPGALDAFAYYPNPEGILVTIRTLPESPVAAMELRAQIEQLLGDRVYSTRGETLEEVIGRLLIENKLTLGIAESCTGGLVAHRITNVPGSSAYLLAGVVAYSNDSKQRILGVPSEIIRQHGAVSPEVASAMAEGVRAITGADIGISTTGIAGPGGATPSKPVGLMFAGISTARETKTHRLQFAEERMINKSRMSQSVLDILRIFVERGS